MDFLLIWDQIKRNIYKTTKTITETSKKTAKTNIF